MRYYFAGAYARRAELVGRAMELEMGVAGAFVTSSWLANDETPADAGFSAGDLVGDRVAEAWSFAHEDLADLAESQVIVSFTGQGERGGRHVEHGYAMAFRELSHPLFRLIVVGPREHVFHCHPDTEVYADFAAFLQHEINREEAE
jgi:hypothetical protein